MKVVAIDLGATSGRVMTVTHENHRFSYEENHRFPNRTYVDSEGYLRWDFAYLLENIKEGIKKALTQNPDIESIGIDTWGVDYGLIKDGKLVSDPTCYRDSHSFDGQKKLHEEVDFQKIYSIAGIQDIHFNTIYQLYSEKNNLNEIDYLLMIPDLIAYFLTGEARLEETEASTTSLYDKNEGKISKTLLDMIGVSERIFPKIIKAGQPYGNLKKEFLPEGFHKDIKVIAVATHDTASAVLGANGEGSFAYISSGTWSLIGTELSEPIKNDVARKYNFTNEIGYNGTVRFLKNTMGMFLVNEIRNDYKNKGITINVKDILPLVEEAKDMGYVIDVNDPIFEKPRDMLNKLKTYLEKHSLPEPKTPGETIKLIYKSMADNYCRTISQLEEITSSKFNSILIVGGGNQAVVLNKYLQEMSGLDVVLGSSEATVLGNSLAQFISLGEIPNAQEGRRDIGLSLKSN